MPMFGMDSPTPPEPQQAEALPAEPIVLDKETIKTRSWIRDQLVLGGFPVEIAGTLAREPGMDYRHAVRLLMASQDLDWTLDQIL